MTDIILNAYPGETALEGFMRHKSWLLRREDGPPAWIRANERLSRAFLASAPAPKPRLDAAAMPIEEALAAPAIRAHHLVARLSQPDVNALRSFASSDAPIQRKALEVLALQGDPSAPDLVEAAIRNQDERVRRMGLRVAWWLRGPEALISARRWMAAGPESDLAERALHIVAESGDGSDVATVRELARAYTDAGDIYPISTRVRTLHALHDTTSIPWFRELVRSIQYSFLRSRCAKALAELDPEFPLTLATECLWDYESETREVGCRTVVETSDIVRERLSTLADNDREDDSTRAAARSALAQGT